VGTGFSDALLRELRVTLEALERATPPFVPPPRGPAHWTEPRLSAEVEFNGRTREGLLRQAAFVGLREDRAAGPLPLLSTPHRILYPDSGLTKLDLSAYYMEVSRWLLPYVEGRLLALVRCPEGQSKPCFFQKHALAGLPSAIRVRPTLEGEGRVSYLYIQDKAGLVGLAQLGVLEIHPWGSRVESIDKPDRCIFDLDPGPDVPAARVVEAARSIRDRLAGLGLLGFVKTTGGKGLHVVVPLSGPLTWKDVKGFSKAVASEMARRAPDRYTATLSKSARQGLIFIDYLRNQRGATAVAAYSPRALPGAPVSVPFAWEELSPDLVSHGPTIRTLGRRLSHLARDPWEGFATLRQSLPRSWSSELSIA